MKALLLAFAAYLSNQDGIHFVTFNDATENAAADRHGSLEVVDRNACTISACNATQCIQAGNILADAGSAAVLKFADCPLRIGQRARDIASDAGLIFPAGVYQQARFIVMKVGTTYGVPVTDTGWPVYAVSSQAFPCAWKPVGGSNCTKLDGGNPGTENTMQSGDWVGAGCVRKACVEIAGTSSAP